MNLYVDFDGIIADSWPIIVKKYYNHYLTDNIEEKKLRELFKICDWNEILKECKKNRNNIKTLKKIEKYNVTILTKINSLSEKRAKEKFLKDNNIKIKIKTVNIDSKKTDIAKAENNILIDDEIKNLKDWKECGGIGILYSKNKDGKDSDGILNDEFFTIFSLNEKFINDLFTAKENI